MEPFSVSTYLTKRAYIVLSLRQAYRNVFVCFLTGLGIIAIIATTLGYFNVIDKLSASVLPWPVVFLPAVVPLAFTYIANKMYRENKRFRSEVVHTFSEQRIAARSPDSDWSYQWEVIRKIERSGPYFLLHITSQAVEIIDATTLTEEQRRFILSGARRVSAPGGEDTSALTQAAGDPARDVFVLPQRMGFLEYARVSVQIYRRSKMVKRLLIYFGIILVLSTALQFFLPSSGAISAWQWALIEALALLLVGSLMVLIGTFILIGINYLVSRRLLKGVTYRFTHWGMERTGVGTDFSLPWRGILRVRETRSFYLFFVSSNSAHAIQKRMFRNSEEAAAFRDFLNDRMSL